MEELELGDWKVERLLGSGAFGEVYLFANKNNEEMMAVKKIHPDSPFAHGNWEKEVEIIRNLRHPGKKAIRLVLCLPSS